VGTGGLRNPAFQVQNAVLTATEQMSAVGGNTQELKFFEKKSLGRSVKPLLSDVFQTSGSCFELPCLSDSSPNNATSDN